MKIIKPNHYTAHIVLKEYLNARQTFLFLRLRVESAEPVQYYAGQYLTLILQQDGERRSYSIVNLPNKDNYLELLVEVFPEGKGAQFVANAAVGDAVEVIVPFGRFVLPETPIEQPMLFVATGSGIVPIKAMIESALRTRNISHPIHLLWGLRYEDDMFWMEEFEQWQKEYANFSYTATLSKPSSNWAGLQGRVTHHLEQHALHDGADVYICGSKGVIHDVREILLAKGVEKKKIFTEQFY